MGEFSPAEDAPVHSQHRLSEAPESQILIPIIAVTIINCLMNSMRILYTLSQRYSTKSIESVKRIKWMILTIQHFLYFIIFNTEQGNFRKVLACAKSLRDAGGSLCRSYSRKEKNYSFL